MAIVLPFPPFSYLPAIIVGGGPGTWFLLAYVLYLAIGSSGFGGLAAFLFVAEEKEGRVLDATTMWLGLILLNAGVIASCILLGLAGALGGYALTINSAGANAVHDILNPYLYPITCTVLIAVTGAALTLLAMIRAKVSAG